MRIIMIQYVLKCATKQLKNFNDIEEGCTLNNGDIYDKDIKTFDELQPALMELENYKSCAVKTKAQHCCVYDVKEYYIEEGDYDEDGNYIGTDISVCAFAENNFDEIKR